MSFTVSALMGRYMPNSDPMSQLIRIDTPSLAALSPSQDTTPDQLSSFYKPSSMPFVRHSPLPVAALSQAGASSKSISQTQSGRAVYGITRNLNQIPVSQVSQGVSTQVATNTQTVTKTLRNLPTSYTLTGSWTNPGNPIDNDVSSFASASSTTSNVVYLATLFTSFSSWFTVNQLNVTLFVTAVSGGAVLVEYSQDSGNTWATLASISSSQSAPNTYSVFIPVTIPTQNVQVRITLPGSSSGTNVTVTDYSGTAGNDSSVGTVAWTNPSNAVGHQTTARATFTHAGNATSQYLKLTNFGFSIPSTATINGIQVSILRVSTSFYQPAPKYAQVSVFDNSVTLYKAGTAAGTAKTVAGNWPNISNTPQPYGSSVDLWGTTWAYSDINNSGFGVGISASLVLGGLASAGTGTVYYAGITVYYTTSSGSSSATVQLYDIAQNVTLG